MNAKHQLFADTYLANGMNALQAYKEVYKCQYSTARANGSELLTKTDISDYIKKAVEAKGLELQNEFGLTTKGQIEKLLYIEDLAIEEKNPTAAIKAVEVQNKLADLNPTEKSEVQYTETKPMIIGGKDAKI